MIDCIYKGWNFFGKKLMLLYSVFISLVYIFYTILISDYLFKVIDLVPIADIKPINYPEYIISSLGFNFVLVFILMIIGFFLINYFVYTVSLMQTQKSSKDFFNIVFKGIPKVFVFTLFLMFVYIALLAFYLILLSYINTITIILLIILFIITIGVVVKLTFATVYLAFDENRIRDALKASSKLIRKRLGLVIGFIILLLVVVSLIYLAVDQLYYWIFFFDTTASLIIQDILMLVIMLYTTSCIAVFAKKYY
jgi:hypothetical protein